MHKSSAGTLKAHVRVPCYVTALTDKLCCCVWVGVVGLRAMYCDSAYVNSCAKLGGKSASNRR